MTRLIVFLMLTFMSLGCKKNDSKTSITISSISDITSTGATIIGELVVNNSVLVISKGICWSDLPKPVYADSKISIGTDPGSFTGVITGLTSSTKYYVRAYVVTTLGTIYGNELSFTTEEKFKNIVDSRDGKTYRTVEIGSQTWFAENLRYSGSIPEVKDYKQWSDTRQPAWCYLFNNHVNDSIYGKLYNWYAVEVGNVCPSGWHVPSDAEWTILINYLDGSYLAGGKLKSTDGWEYSNLRGTNESGFSALPGDHRHYQGTFSGQKRSAYWWSSTEIVSGRAWFRVVDYEDNIVDRFYGMLNTGYSIRCVKD